MTRIRIGVMGAGSIGSYVGGKVLAADAADVILVGRPWLQDEVAKNGLRVKDFDDEASHVPAERVQIVTDPAPLAECDVVLCCVKSTHTPGVARSLAVVLRADTLVASFQNGLRNAEVLGEALGEERVAASIVGFNVVSRGEGLFHRAMAGSIAMQASRDPRQRALLDALRASGIGVDEPGDLAPHQWTKLMVNLNNAVSAISGAPSRQLILSPGHRRIVSAVIDEGLSVLRAAGIRPAKLRGVPVGLMPKVLRLPTPLVRLVTRAQLRVDPEARSSMWEDLTRGRKTEVDFLNGEIVQLAERSGVAAPLNRRLVELVREAEEAGEGPPNLDADVLWARLTA